MYKFLDLLLGHIAIGLLFGISLAMIIAGIYKVWEGLI